MAEHPRVPHTPLSPILGEVEKQVSLPARSSYSRLYSKKAWVRFPFTPAQIAVMKVGEAVTISE